MCGLEGRPGCMYHAVVCHDRMAAAVWLSGQSVGASYPGGLWWLLRAAQQRDAEEAAHIHLSHKTHRERYSNAIRHMMTFSQYLRMLTQTQSSLSQGGWSPASPACPH